jgi:uncharacterized membrane protein YqaE (UPF0057 family)
MGDRPRDKHLERKDKVLQKQSAFISEPIKEKSGILAITILYFWDSFVEFFFRIFFATIDISKFAFNYIYNAIFGNYQGVIPSIEKNGTLMTFRPMRYIVTFFVPPLGVFMSKGLMGWFNVIICLILCYVNYIIGIFYAFIITANSRYSDRFEKRDIEEKEENNNRDENNKQWKVIFLVIGTFFFIMFGIMLSSAIKFNLGALNLGNNTAKT